MSRSQRLPAPDAHDLAIRFVNTVAWRLRATPEDRLSSPRRLLTWMADQGLAARSQPAGAGHPTEAAGGDADELHRVVLRLRDVLYRILVSAVVGEAPLISDLRAFEEMHRAALSECELVRSGDTLMWRPVSEDSSSVALLAPITQSAAELMTGPRAGRVRQCQDEAGCGWLFVDESRAGNRRWCSMGDCGNRAKARRHYRRQERSAPVPR